MPQPAEPIDPRLDRWPFFDDRSRKFQVRTLLDSMAAEKRMRGRGWSPGPTLDQGREGACIGFGNTHRRNGRPVNANLVNADAFHLYRLAQKHDRAMGNHWSEGASVLAGMKAGEELGWWKAYRWIGAGSQTPIDDFIDSTIDIGPVVLGIPWKDSMMTPRPSGLLDCSGRVIGGHCICAPAVRLRMRLPSESPKPMEVGVLQNSWGDSYGIGLYGQPGGFVLIKLADLESLLHDQGEGAVPIELR